MDTEREQSIPVGAYPLEGGQRKSRRDLKGKRDGTFEDSYSPAPGGVLNIPSLVTSMGRKQLTKKYLPLHQSIESPTLPYHSQAVSRTSNKRVGYSLVTLTPAPDNREHLTPLQVIESTKQGRKKKQYGVLSQSVHVTSDLGSVGTQSPSQRQAANLAAKIEDALHKPATVRMAEMALTKRHKINSEFDSFLNTELLPR